MKTLISFSIIYAHCISVNINNLNIIETQLQLVVIFSLYIYGHRYTPIYPSTLSRIFLSLINRMSSRNV